MWPLALGVIVAHCLRTTCGTKELALSRADIIAEARDLGAMGGGIQLVPMSPEVKMRGALPATASPKAAAAVAKK